MKIWRVLLVALIVITMSLVVTVPVSATPTLREYWNTGGDANSIAIYGGEFVAQQFTSDATSHTVSSVKVELLYAGSPSTVKLSLYNAAAGVPTTEITSVTYNVAGFLSTIYTMVEFNIPDQSLLPSTQYAIVISVTGTVADYVWWHQDSGGGLANAVGLHSHTSGVAWTSDTPADYLFEVYGDVVFQVVSANVFTDYAEDGDWLIAIECINAYPGYFNVTDVSRYFNVQLLNVAGTQVLAATTLKSWGDSPVAIYLSPTSVIPLTYGASYIIRMIGTFAGTPSVALVLDTEDWVGSDLRYLDQWCLTTAKNMNAYDGNTTTEPYTIKTSTGGELLTSYGGGDFIKGIPSIMRLRPDLFNTSTLDPDYETGTSTNAYDNAHTWQGQVGTVITADATTWGALFGITAKQLLSLGMWIIYLFGVVFIFVSRSGAETIFALLVSVPILLIGLNFRIIEFQVFAIAGVLAVLLFVIKMWFTK